MNKTDSAVRITHIPSGIVVACQNERSQLQNRAGAMAMLRVPLPEKNRRAEELKKEDEGKTASADFGSQIRSYAR